MADKKGVPYNSSAAFFKTQTSSRKIAALQGPKKSYFEDIIKAKSKGQGVG